MEKINYKHENFNKLSKEELDLYLSFTAKVLNKLVLFEVWEAENIFDDEDYSEWIKGAIEVLLDIDKYRVELEDLIYSFK